MFITFWKNLFTLEPFVRKYLFSDITLNKLIQKMHWCVREYSCLCILAKCFIFSRIFFGVLITLNLNTKWFVKMWWRQGMVLECHDSLEKLGVLLDYRGKHISIFTTFEIGLKQVLFRSSRFNVVLKFWLVSLYQIREFCPHFRPS